MNSQIRDHLKRHDILPSVQSGFRPGYSCATALLNITDDIFRTSDQDRITALVMLDFTKAFDRVNHQLLLSILHYIGFSDLAIALISSYLVDRTQYVETDRGVSSALHVPSGVPQGSILGPILFSIYTCKLYKSLRYCSVHQYADDTQLYISFTQTEREVAMQRINYDISELVKFSKDHNLQINPTKSILMLFAKNREISVPDFLVKIEGETVMHTLTARSLGLELDSCLRFRPHINKCIKKAYANLKVLYPSRKILSRPLKIKLTDALVLSHFNYCDIVYGPCLDHADTLRIQRVQKSCLRFIYGIRRRDPISYKLKETGWITMENRRKVHSAVFFHKLILSNCPPYLLNKITYRTDVHSLNLRFRGYISPPPHRTAFFERSFSFHIYKLFNSIPEWMRSLSLSSFKTNYRRYVFSSE